jgi:NitT/TauT family transport system substrate-binding protein
VSPEEGIGMERRFLRAALAVVAAALLLFAAACGDDDEAGSAGADASGSAAPAKLTVGVIPIAAVAPLYLGIEQGYFEQEKLEIEPRFEEGGVNVVTAVISGDFDMGFSNTLSLMTAVQQGLPITRASPARRRRRTPGARSS